MENINDIVNNQPLLDAISAVRENENGNTQAKMAVELARAKFFTPMEATVKPDENGNIQLDKGQEIKLNVINTQEGEMYLPAFTSWEELEKWGKNENQQTLLSKFSDYERMIFEGGNLDCRGFVIDPFGVNIRLTRRNMIAIREMLEDIGYKEEKPQIRKQQNERVTVQMGEPREYPTELVESVKEFMKNESGIKSGYLQMMVKGDKPGFLIAVDYEGDKDRILRGVIEAAKDYLPKGFSLDVMPFEKELKKILTEKAKPFYENTD